MRNCSRQNRKAYRLIMFASVAPLVMLLFCSLLLLLVLSGQRVELFAVESLELANFSLQLLDLLLFLAKQLEQHHLMLLQLCQFELRLLALRLASLQ
ncbi:hypothetical protein KRP22_008132 [Phytophthora ramorum]|uniref:uncharacterized protein n=1 Tax=Phytophthora ramorum TaxID=164328 RepID=UPI0030A9EB9E|nr:hypothetical protein KRP23_12854 [Phytophthora ramorum]KAH7505887.1 hypothetical protein KRP22_3857 [Phytophthora ramorum]